MQENELMNKGMAACVCVCVSSRTLQVTF